MIPTSNSDNFNIELLNLDDSKTIIEFRYPTLKEYREFLKAQKEIEAMQDGIEHIDAVQELIGKFSTQKEKLDEITPIQLSELYLRYISEYILSENEKKRLQQQRLQSIPEQQTNHSSE